MVIKLKYKYQVITGGFVSVLVALNIFLNGPEPSNCKGANCSNAIFFEEHIEKLKNSVDKKIEPHLKERLEKNIYFMEAGGFEQEPFIKLIKEYDNYKDKGVS